MSPLSFIIWVCGLKVVVHSMPVEHLSVLFKPSSFFTKNPSMDVPGTMDSQSKPAFETNGTRANGTNGSHACCAN